MIKHIIKRREVSHDKLWWAVLRGPLGLFYFIAPFIAGVFLSPQFGDVISVPEWLGTFGFAVFIFAIVYINGVAGAFFLGIPLYYFLNAVKMQNRWIYLLAGFAGGTIVNILYPWYSKQIYTIGESADAPLAKIGIASYPILFGLLGMAVAWNFWRELTLEKKKK